MTEQQNLVIEMRVTLSWPVPRYPDQTPEDVNTWAEKALRYKKLKLFIPGPQGIGEGHDVAVDEILSINVWPAHCDCGETLPQGAFEAGSFLCPDCYDEAMALNNEEVTP